MQTDIATAPEENRPLDDPTLDLVARFRAGDTQAADALFQRYAGRLGGLVRKSKSRRSNLNTRERDELWSLVKKATIGQG